MACNPNMATYPSLRDKVVVITGGAEGIGAAAVVAFAHQGSKVMILDIASDSATDLIQSIQAHAISSTQIPEFHYCDVTDLERLKSVAADIITKHKTVNVLVNNAALSAASARVPTQEVTPSTWESSINVNLRHQFFLTQYLAPHMARNGGGSIINMGSITWRVPTVGSPVYAAAKAAIHGLTKTHAREFGKDGIRVNSVMPGSIATERQVKEVLTEEYRDATLEAQALKRVLRPEEVARVVCFLASEDASAITGSSYCVDGGWVGDP